MKVIIKYNLYNQPKKYQIYKFTICPKNESIYPFTYSKRNC